MPIEPAEAEINNNVVSAMVVANQKLKDWYWTFCKGRCSPDEPLYGFDILKVIDGEPVVIVRTEHNNPVRCVEMAISELKEMAN